MLFYISDDSANSWDATADSLEALKCELLEGDSGYEGQTAGPFEITYTIWTADNELAATITRSVKA